MTSCWMFVGRQNEAAANRPNGCMSGRFPAVAGSGSSPGGNLALLLRCVTSCADISACRRSFSETEDKINQSEDLLSVY